MRQIANMTSITRKSVHYTDSFDQNEQKKLHSAKKKSRSHSSLHLKRREHRIGNNLATHSLEDLTSQGQHSVNIIIISHNNYESSSKFNLDN